MEGLFETKQAGALDIKALHYNADRELNPLTDEQTLVQRQLQNATRDNVLQRLISLFRRHGAVFDVLPVLQPTQWQQSSRGVKRLLERSGLLVDLPRER